MYHYLARFTCGYAFGALVWFIIVSPYRSYYDFTFGYYWPELAFSISIALLFTANLSARSTITLFLPSLIGGATQNYIIILLLTSLLAHPLSNVGLNSVESVRVIGCSLTLTFDQLSERAKLVLSPILEILSDQDQADLDPIRQDLVRIQQYIGQIKKNAQLIGNRSGDGISLNRTITTTTTTSGKPITAEDATTSKTGIKLEWDPENFGVRANIDMQKLRSLAKSGRLQEYLGQNRSASMNLTDVLYTSCLNIFHDAKRECSDSVQDLLTKCQKTIGPYLATWWCAPFTYSLDAFCPWIMDQLVDERSLCKQVKIVDITSPHGGIRVGKGRVLNVNEAFQTLNNQIDHLNQHLLIDDRPSARDQQRANRLEIHLTFNEQTRNIFQTTKSVIEFISDKYKMRRLLIKALLFTYDVYTTYTFLLILAQAWRYRAAYLSDIKFDNCYITSDFVELDRQAANEDDDAPVLPLSGQESKRYITTFSCRRRTHEERQVQRLSLTIAIVFLAFTLSLFYLDNIFYSLLVSIHDHSLIRFKELGHHELDVRVRGDGVIARLVKRLVGHLNSVYNLDRYTSTRQCLPEPRVTANKFYLHFTGLVILYFLIDQISIYAMRLRRVTCAYFYPDKERQRVQFLRKTIRHKRNRPSGHIESASLSHTKSKSS